jgi:AAA domain-containing protein
VPPDYWSAGLNEEAERLRQKAAAEEAARRRERNGGGGAATGNRFRFTAFRDIALEASPAYTVADIIPRLGVVVVWGKPKCGKTFWTFDVEMHVALGRPYRGHRVEQGVVVHIACEGVAGLAARKEAWRQYHVDSGYDAAELDAAPFYLCKETSLDLIRDADEVARSIVIQFEGRPIRIITIDTLNRSLKGSESKDEDMAAYIRAAVVLAEKFQCAVLIVHHCGYDTTHPRGHTSLIGAVDADIEVTKEETGQVRTEVKNMRDGANGTQTCSRLEPIEVGYDDNGDSIVSCVILSDGGEDFPKKEQKTKPPSAAQVVALQLLAKAIDRGGEDPPSEIAHLVPPHGKCVTEDVWRRYCYEGSISAGDQHAKNAAFNRAAHSLLAKNLIRKWISWVWLT